MSFLSTYKIPQPRGYSDQSYYIEDISDTSPNYFDVVDFPTVVGGGRYSIKLKGNGTNMRLNSTIDVEIIDAEGTNIFCEVITYADRFNNYFISMDIYDITAQGLATVYLVGEAIVDDFNKPVPSQYQNKYNVRWQKDIMVMPFERNITDLSFDEPPIVSVAQIITPARVQTQSTSSAYAFVSVTGSGVDLLSMVTSNFKGYDRDFSTSEAILDPRIKSIQVDPLAKPITVNSVPTAVREKDNDIQNGNLINYTTRFNTKLLATSSFFKKEHLGGYFEFYDTGSYPQIVQPALPSGIAISGSSANQYDHYYSTIVEIINDRQAIISKPLQITTLDTNGVSRNRISSFTYKNVSMFTGSITYVPTDLFYVTSSTVSQSYVEFTFADMNPISGQVYRIKTSIKLGSVTGDYKLLNDQVINPVEYLTDAAYPNPTNYARHESEYRLIGHFTTQSFLNDYWTCYREDKGTFDVITGSLDNGTLIESTKLYAQYTQSSVLTTQFFQNYNSNQIYTLGFYVTLEPFTELEVYMGSDPLNGYLITPQTSPRAFYKTNNLERTLLPGQRTPYGKYVGKITNSRSNTKQYGKVLFDFETDSSGFGAPVFRSKIVNEKSDVAGRAKITGSIYLAEISIKPYTLNGFTPNIVQYAVPLPAEFVQAAAVSQSMDFRIDYFDYTGKQSEFSTYLDDVILNLKAEIPSNTCQTDKLNFTFDSNYYIAQPID